MEYKENLEWKKLYKDKKYKEAAETLNHEMAVNLLRVHNLYSDVKYDPEKKEYIAYGIPLYAKNSKNELISEIEEFYDYSCILDFQDTGIFYSKGIKEEKNVYNSSLKLRKKIKTLFKKYSKQFKEKETKMMTNLIVL